MRFRVLGPIEVIAESGPIPLGGPKQRAVLAHLIVQANRVVSADALIDRVWGDEPPEAAKNSLQSYVSHLRRVLGANRLEGRPPGYVLHLAPEELDASVFEALVHEARAAGGDADRVARILREALGLWRGPAFADLAGESALSGEIARLEELRLQSLEQRLEADLAAGRLGDAVGELARLTREHPHREGLWASFMLALYRSGRQADALAAFQRARRILGDELGVDPSPELQRLQERLLRQDPDLDIKGRPLRGYRLLDQVGGGALGVVHLAIQPQVGREVAVKAIHPELADRPDFVRRFEREAQLVARLEHPHVVPLYDYWREPGGAYLVMRFLRGGSLRALVEQGPLEVDRAVGILDQVAAGLAAAHRQGVIHGDVKLGNVLLDDEGNAYLSDFDVGLGAGATERTTEKTLRSDVAALGMLLYAMLTGEHPSPDSIDAPPDQHLHQPLPSVRVSRPELPPSVDAVIARATATRSEGGFPEALEVATAFRAAVEGQPQRPAPLGESRNPYKGLRAFFDADSADFFGRESLVRRLAARLAEPGPRSRFLCVVGPSGSGKSSVVRAGLVPALRRGAVEGSDRWFFLDVVPGPRPLRELESALLGVAIQPPPSLLDELERDELGLARAVERVLPDAEAELLIVLDQLEELFTLVDEAQRLDVLEAIRAAVETPGSRIRVVATLRADFFDQPLSVRGFGDLLAERTEAITPMSPEQLERAIVGPAERVGLTVEPGLLAAMVSDVADRPGALPLLQFALTELTERHEGGLTLAAYRAIGGVSGAIARRAEHLYGEADDAGRDAIRQVFLRLVALGEGTEDTRRRARRSELDALEVDRDSMDSAIEAFGRYRLLSFDRDDLTREPTVELAHEALIHAWTRLRDWIDEVREDVRTHRRLVASADEWVGSGHEASFLLTGSRLERLASWMSETPLAIGRAERGFLDASLARREEEVEAERARAAHDRSVERRSVRRRRAFVATLAVASLVAASLTAIAVNRSREAERIRGREVAGRLTASSLGTLDTDPELSLLLAMHAVHAVTSGDRVPAATVEALHWAIQRAGVEYPRDGPTAVIVGPSGATGVFDLPLSDLLGLARSHVTRSLSAAECERYFSRADCPPLPGALAGGVSAEPVRAVDPVGPATPLAGTHVGLWPGAFDDGPRAGAFRRELEAFTAATGIDVDVIDIVEIPEAGLRSRVAAGDPPDLAVIDRPPEVRDYALEGALIDLGAYLDVAALRNEQSPYLVSLGTIDAEGSWPADDGGTYGAFIELNVKSLIWYPKAAFESAGYDVPTTWADLVALSDRMVSDGRTPWCLGFESGLASGWPGTDWIENLVIGGAGLDAYDAWTRHEMRFDDVAIRAAFARLGQVVFPEGFVFGGTESALETSFDEAAAPMFRADPPECWLHQGASFIADSFRPAESVGTEFDAFAFPRLEEGSPVPVLGGGSMVSAFADRPEVRELVRFLASAEFGAELATSGGSWISPNQGFDVGQYSPISRRQAAMVDAALEADAFRFDGSDLMPSEIGSGEFWAAMMTYLREGPESLDRILAEIDAAWPQE